MNMFLFCGKPVAERHKNEAKRNSGGDEEKETVGIGLCTKCKVIKQVASQNKATTQELYDIQKRDE